MASITLQVNSVRAFVSSEVASPETTDIDLERFKRSVELHLQDLLRAVQADLQAICDNCCPPATSP